MPPVALILTVSTSLTPVEPGVVVVTMRALERSRPRETWSCALALSVRVPLPPSPISALAMLAKGPLIAEERRKVEVERAVELDARPRSKVKVDDTVVVGEKRRAAGERGRIGRERRRAPRCG